MDRRANIYWAVIMGDDTHPAPAVELFKRERDALTYALRQLGLDTRALRPPIAELRATFAERRRDNCDAGLSIDVAPATLSEGG